MLIKEQEVLIPHDINRDLLNFISDDAGETRFVIGTYIPTAPITKFFFDKAHIVKSQGELELHTQRGSRHYPLRLYAWEHIFCLVPSSARIRKNRKSWLSDDFSEIVKHEEFSTWWLPKDVVKFVESQRDAY